MKKHRCISFIVSAVLVLSFVLTVTEIHACTGIRLETQDGNYIFTRTLEFGTELVTFDLISVPRNYKYVGLTPSGKPGMTWKTKYAYVGFDQYGMDTVTDGLNEKGLACGAFFMPGYAKFQDLTKDDYSRAISNVDLVSWVLSTCSTVSEVRERLPKILVCGVMLDKLGMLPPFHYMAADNTGDCIIIEYLDGKLNIFDNEVNAITNSPTYPWQTTNVRNYIGLKPLNNPAVKIDGTEFAQFGQGSGAIGLPGDFSPPSRFIRATYYANVANKGKDVDEGINIAFHIMNQFDIPKGSIRGNVAGKAVSDTTQWTSAADLKNRRYFYTTYADRSIRKIELNELDFINLINN